MSLLSDANATFAKAKLPTAQPLAAPGLLDTFYRAVLPEAGSFCLFLLPEARHVWAESIEELVSLTDDYQDRSGVYFGTAAFDTIVRKQANVLGLRSLRLDIDAGPEKLAKHGIDEVYATQQDAVADSIRFFKTTKLVPSFIVSSGAGLHIYFCFDQDLTPEQWLPLAKALSFKGVQHDYKVDPSVTEDSARILRPPGAIHHFGTAGFADDGDVRVKILKATGKTYGYAEMSELLGAQAPTRKYDTSINDDAISKVEGPPSSAFKVAEKCGALREVAQAGGDVPEPYWRAMLGLVKFTVEGDDVAHEWSQGYDSYDARATAKKLAAWATGPTTCSEFSKHSRACATCEHRGKIKSPIVLGWVMDEVVKASLALVQSTLPDWHATKDGIKTRPQNTTDNIAALLAMNGWSARYNVMTKRTETVMPGNRAARDDHENAALAFLGDSAIRAGMARNGIQELVEAVAGDNAYHPVQEWIEATPWDQTSKLSLFHESLELIDPCHASLRDRLMDAWALQVIGAIFEADGIAAQGILVLAGAQGTNKTRWVANLCPVPGAVRTGIHLNPLDKDSVLQATNGLIVELGELDSTTRKSDLSALKAFTTRNEDVLRPAYARKENVYRRRTVFVGTVNGTGFLVDATGDRRFWTNAVKFCHLLPAEVMQQIWAEYLAKYLAGERWHLDAATKAALCDTNAAHRVVDPIRERILTVFDWSSTDWDTIAPENWRSHPKTQWLTATDICIRIGLDRPSKADATRAGSIVSELNRASHRKSNGAKLLAVPVQITQRG